MRLGIMATTFARPTLEATLDAVAACVRATAGMLPSPRSSRFPSSSR